jgi:cellulose synthase/poly-beta-1,6-N-acetylglucosamine synthase-like glycosyltransferase
VEALSWIVIAFLASFSARRFALLFGALLHQRPVEASEEPSVLVVVAAHDEAWQVEPLLHALSKLEYPAERLSFVLISDGSRDQTAQIFRRWCGERPRAIAIELIDNVGKAAAINAALSANPAAALLAVYDADERPRPDSLRKLAHAFGDACVAAASGYRSPSNPLRGIVSRYAVLETWVHQLIVLAGKERWGWNPPTMGSNCVYRIAAVAELGGFPEDTFSEDIEMSLSMIASGWRTRFLRDAVAESTMGTALRHYASQRIRWTYGMYGASRHARSLEALAVASGYADRLVFVAGCVFAMTSRISPAWLIAYLSAPFLQMLAALAKAGRLRQAPVYFLSAVPMFFFDIGSTVYATMLTAVRRRPYWHQRVADAVDASKSHG